MTILIRGTDGNYTEFKSKFPSLTDVSLFEEEKFSGNQSDLVVFDFGLDDNPDRIKEYTDHPGLIVFGNSVKKSLSEIAKGLQVRCQLFGFNGLPTFFDRPLLEVSCYDESQRPALEEILRQLDTDFELIRDRVGMVTPRIIFMIINEAYFTVQEGTASREDIDLGMKLGTSYPFGPFEWKDRIGIRNIYEVLDAVYHDTHDERYKICPLLKTEYQRSSED